MHPRRPFNLLLGSHPLRIHIPSHTRVHERVALRIFFEIPLLYYLSLSRPRVSRESGALKQSDKAISQIARLVSPYISNWSSSTRRPHPSLPCLLVNGMCAHGTRKKKVVTHSFLSLSPAQSIAVCSLVPSRSLVPFSVHLSRGGTFTYKRANQRATEEGEKGNIARK